MQDKTIELFGSGPVNNPLEKEHGHALATPGWLGKNVYDDGVTAFCDFVSRARSYERVR